LPPLTPPFDSAAEPLLPLHFAILRAIMRDVMLLRCRGADVVCAY